MRLAVCMNVGFSMSYTAQREGNCRGSSQMAGEHAELLLFYLSCGRSGQLYLAELHSLVQSYILINLRQENKENEDIRAEQCTVHIPQWQNCAHLFLFICNVHLYSLSGPVVEFVILVQSQQDFL